MKSKEEYLATMEHIRKLVQEAVRLGSNQIEVFEYVQTMLPKDTVSQNDLANIVRDEYFRTNPLFTKGSRPFGTSSLAPSYQCFILDEYSDTISATNADNFHQVVDFFNEHGVSYEKVKKEGENVFVYRTTRENSKRKKNSPTGDLVEVGKYINAIRNVEKKQYARDYFLFVLGRTKGEPRRELYKLGTMGRQAVRLSIDALMKRTSGSTEPMKNPQEKLVKAHKKFNFKEPRNVSTQNLPINEHDQLFEVGMMPRIHYVSTKEGQDVEYEHKFKHDVRVFCSVGKKYLVVMRKDRKPFDVSDWFYD